MNQPNSLTHVAENGATWTFDPVAQKWGVTFDGQRSTSQNYETLTTKLGKWVHVREEALQKTNVPADAPSEPLSFRFGLAMALSSGANLLNGDIPPRPESGSGVTVKTSWDAKTERFKIERFKTVAANKDSGWGTQGADSLWLTNFEALDASDQAWWRDVFEVRAKLHIAQQAHRAVGQAWMQGKDDRTTFHQAWFGYGPNSQSDIKPIARADVAGASRVSAVPSDMPLIPGWELQSMDGWVEQQGSWHQGHVRLRFKASGAHQPTFIVEHVNEQGQATQVWSSSVFHDALAVANATFKVEEEALPDVSVWRHVMPTSAHRDLNVGRWPTNIRASLAVFLKNDDGRQGLVLMLGEEKTFTNMDVLNRIKDEGERKQGWVSQSLSNDSISFLPAGPEDDAMQLVAFALDRAAQEVTAPFLAKNDHGSLQLRMARQTQATLKHAYDLVCDGETLNENPLHMVSRWEDTVRREEARAATLPSVIAFSQRCAALVDQATFMANDVAKKKSSTRFQEDAAKPVARSPRLR